MRERTGASAETEKSPNAERRREVFLFVFLAVVIWPILSVAVVGGYGFLVWMYQLIAGPPGPPGV